MKVLLLDDHVSARVSFGAVLEQGGFHVIEATTLAEARRRLQENRFDAAVLDLYLPDGLGIDLVRELRSAHPSVVIAILSGADELKLPSADLFFRKADAPTEHMRRLKHALGFVASGGAP